MNGSSRVKHRTMPQTGRNARFVFREIAERCGGKRLCAVGLTAELPQGEL